MSRIFQPLLFLLARCTRNELIRQVELLKAEILRSRVPRKHIHLKREEKARLVKLGTAIGSGLKQLITVVRYQTQLRWVRETNEGHTPKKIGRPRTDESIRNLIVKISSETGSGYTRVMGELKKLQLKPPSRSTVKRIIQEHQHDREPRDVQGSWSEFLRLHAETLWQCDFFSKRMWTKFGLRQFFVLPFVHVGSRRVFVSPCTLKPTSAWVKQQVEAFVRHAAEAKIPASLVTRDRDRNYHKPAFDDVLKAAGIRVRRTTYRSPNLQAYVEGFIQSLQQECLDHFILCGERHVNYLVSQYVEHYHTERPHQAKGNRPLTGEWPDPGGEAVLGEVVRRDRLGGLLGRTGASTPTLPEDGE